MAAHGSPTNTLIELTGGARRLFIRVAFALGAINILVPLCTILLASTYIEHYRKLFFGDDNLITWFSTFQLTLIGMAAYANHIAAGLVRQLDRVRGGRSQWIWLVSAFGFVILAIDERFRIHEDLRDNVLLPSGLFDGISFLASGDMVVLLIYLGIGLAFGLVIMVMIYAVGDISGAHFNPAVSIGFWRAGSLPSREDAPYALAQLAGALFASALLRVLFLEHPTVDSWTSPSSRLERVRETAQRFVAARPRATSRYHLLARHGLLHNLFDVARSDVTLSWWTGSATFLPRKIPPRR